MPTWDWVFLAVAGLGLVAIGTVMARER